VAESYERIITVTKYSNTLFSFSMHDKCPDWMRAQKERNINVSSWNFLTREFLFSIWSKRPTSGRLTVELKARQFILFKRRTFLDNTTTDYEFCIKRSWVFSIIATFKVFMQSSAAKKASQSVINLLHLKTLICTSSSLT